MKVVSVQMKPRPRRTWLERALMTAPELYRALAAPIFRLPPGNRLRTAALKAVIDHSYSALSRGDLELTARLFFHPDSVLIFGEDPGPDYERRYEGRERSFDAYRRWMEEWGSLQRRPVGFVDRGDRLVVLGRELVRGESSGVELDRELGQVFRLRGASVIEHVEYRNWKNAVAH